MSECDTIGTGSNPFLNREFRPGMGKVNLESPESREYNRDVTTNTIRWAILDWLRHEHLNGIWKVCWSIYSMAFNP
jgi:hypothetical protein